jgi:predicted SAM-dependent methyltransferase
MSGDHFLTGQGSGPATLDDLLQCHDRQFVESAYRSVLARNADTDGFQFYLARLRSGIKKLDIVNELSKSEEALARGGELQGLRSSLRWHRLMSIPLLGPLIGLFYVRATKIDAPIEQFGAAAASTPGSRRPGLQSLLHLQDTDFVEAAYWAILKRAPEPDGLTYYSTRLRGGVRKLQILGELASSEEARKAGVEIPGLAAALRMQRLSKVPLLGHLAGFGLRLEGDSNIEVRSRVAEQQVFLLKKELSRISQRHHHLETQMRPLEDLQHRFVTFQTQQLPTLVRTLSELNHRQLASDSDRINLVKSVPIALRTITRDIFELRARQENMSLAADGQFVQLADRLASTDQRFDVIRERLQEATRLLDQRIDAVRDKMEGASGIADQVHSALRDVGYLLGRVEFVRRELMFEMRYGATAPSGSNDKLRAECKILSPEKLGISKTAGIRLNLGCGHVALEKYLNVDRRALPGVDIVAEIDDLPFSPGQVDEIFSAHVIEHFPQEQLRRNLLVYWRDLLKPGGDFRVVAPDAEGMMNAYFKGEYPFERLREVTFGGQDYNGDFHFNMLNTKSLTSLLLEAGFTDVKVIAENRENGGCKEFEVLARRPDVAESGAGDG